MARTGSHPEWKGFERTPEGRLLAQRVDITGPMGLAYERSVGFKKDFHVHDRDMIVCPRGASEMRIRARPAVAGRSSWTIDADVVLFVPKTCNHDDEALSTVYDTVALYPSDELVAHGLREAGVPRREAKRLASRPFVVRRTRWFSEALDRYFAERVLGTTRTMARDRLAFLETELVSELFRGAERSGNNVGERRGEALDDQDSPFARALRFVEANLFQPIEVTSLAKRSGASVSTLLRAFRRELGLTPYAYVKARRLDEAKRLLRLGNLQVQQIALLVGYEDLPAFSKAFKRHFGATPREHRESLGRTAPRARSLTGSAARVP